MASMAEQSDKLRATLKVMQELANGGSLCDSSENDSHYNICRMRLEQTILTILDR